MRWQGADAKVEFWGYKTARWSVVLREWHAWTLVNKGYAIEKWAFSPDKVQGGNTQNLEISCIFAP